MERPGQFFLLGLVFMIANGALSSTGVGIIFVGPLLAGMYYSIQKAINTGDVEIGDLFKGFSIFVPAMVAGLLIGLFQGIGFVLCIVPGIIVTMMYKMTYLFILDRDMDFWPAMEASRRLFFANFLPLSLLYIVEALLVTAGVLLCYVGVFFAYPLTVAMTAFAYKSLVGFEKTGPFEPGR